MVRAISLTTSAGAYNLNFSYNDNKIKELNNLPNGLTLTVGRCKSSVKEGGHYGDLYVRHLMRDENGKPLQNEGRAYRKW